MTTLQQTIQTYENGNKEQAYDMFLNDENAISCDFSKFCTAMEKMIVAKHEQERNETIFATLEWQH